MATSDNRPSNSNTTIFASNFGGYVLAAAVVLFCYSAVDMVAPGYSTLFAMLTLLGIVLFYFKKG